MHHLIRPVARLASTSVALLAVTSAVAADFPVTLTISATSGTVSSAQVTATFPSQPATSGAGAFALTDLAVTGGSVSGLTTLSATQARFTFTASATTAAAGNTATVRVNAGSVSNPSGSDTNASASNLVSYLFDTIKPAVTLTTSASTSYGVAFTVTAQWNEAPIGFTAGDITVTNGGQVSAFTAVDADTYTFSVASTSAVVVGLGITIPAGSVTDATGNTVNLTSINRTWDPVDPTATLASTTGSSVKVAPIPFTLNWSKVVYGLTAGDLVITNGVASALSTSNGSSYTFTVTPSGQGVVSIEVPAGVANDASGNPTAGPVTISRTYDTVAPTVSLSVEPGSPTSGSLSKSSTIGVLVTFSEAISTGSFTGSDVSATNAVVGTPTLVSGNTYKVVLTPSAITASSTSGAAVGVSILAGGVPDLAGNANAASTGLTWTIDRSAPTVVLTSSSSTTVSGTFPVTVTFSEPVVGFSASEVVITGGTGGSYTGSGSSYTLVVTPSATATTVVVSLPAGLCADAAGNANVVATNLSRNYDSGPLTGVLTSSASATTAISPIPFTVTWNNPVSGFDATDLTITNGTVQVGSFSATSSTQFGFRVVPTAQGTVTVSIAAGRCVKVSGGTSNAAVSAITRFYDSVGPTATLSIQGGLPASGSLTKAATIGVLVSFSEAITGNSLATTDFQVLNAAVGTPTLVSGTTWRVVLTPGASAASVVGGVPVSVQLKAGSVLDAGGLANAAVSNTLNWTVDRGAPKPFLSSTALATVNGPFSVTATFAEAVTGFAVGDLTLTGATASAFTPVSSTVYTFTVNPTSGSVIVAVGAGKCVDAAGNANVAAANLTRTFNASALTGTLSSTAAAKTRTAPIPFTISWSARVNGFALNDITVVNGTAASLVNVANNQTFNFTVTPAAEGVVSVSVAAGRCTNDSGTGNTAVATINRTYDPVAPTVTLSVLGGSPPNGTLTNAATVGIQVSFSEAIDVATLAAADFTVTNGVAGAPTLISGNNYKVILTPSATANSVTMSVNMAAGKVKDLAGNNNTLSNTRSWTVDRVRPSVVLGSPSATTVGGVFTVSATFSSAVSGFTLADIGVTNGSAATFSAVSASVYTFSVVPATAGTVIVSVAAGKCQDAAGNTNTAAVSLTRIYDIVSPSVTLSTPVAVAITNAATFQVTFTFSKNVTGFAGADITVTNGGKSGFTVVNAKTYRITITPTADGPVTVKVNAGVCADSSGNLNLASTTLSRTSDRTQPTAVLSTAAVISSTTAKAVTVTLSEPVTGLTAADFVIGNGSVVGLSVVSGTGGLQYNLSIRPATIATVTVDLPAGRCADSAGNTNAVVTQLAIAASGGG